MNLEDFRASAEYSALVRDAMRYRWLRAHHSWQRTVFATEAPRGLICFKPVEFDRLVDKLSAGDA